jgi:hypothetical protein
MKPGWIEAWESEPTVDRMKMCIRMIAVHGLLSDSERANVAKRFVKWQERRLRKASNA